MRRVFVIAGLTIVPVLFLSGIATTVDGFVLRANRWPSTTATFNVDIGGAEGLWDTAFETAMFRWSVAGFDYRINRETFENPCDGLPSPTSLGDFQNGVAFTSDICGEAFGENILAWEAT